MRHLKIDAPNVYWLGYIMTSTAQKLTQKYHGNTFRKVVKFGLQQKVD